MGASSSTGAHVSEPESLSRDQILLQTAFEDLVGIGAGTRAPSIAAHDLQNCFNIRTLAFKEAPGAAEGKARDAEKFAREKLGAVVAEKVFGVTGDSALEWEGFLKGFNRCCKQDLGAIRLNLLLSLLPRISKGEGEAADFSTTSRVSREDPEEIGDGDVSVDDFGEFLKVCWLMTCFVELKGLYGSNYAELLRIEAPDVELLSTAARLAVKSGPENAGRLPLKALHAWILSAIPGLTDCLSQYVLTQLERVAETAEKSSQSLKKKEFSENLPSEELAESVKPGLLTAGTAWAVGLSHGERAISRELVKASTLIGVCSRSQLDLLYRSSIDGKSLNRFWTQVQGYEGPILLLIAAKSVVDSLQSQTQTSTQERWVIGALVPGGFLNKDTYYGGSSCCLFGAKPVFLAHRPTGRDKFFVYSHRHVPGTGYRAHPAPEGVGFGGELGNERVWLDEDFECVTLRHHSVDKTYSSGPLVPEQGYGSVKGGVSAVEVWGLGGQAALEKQAAFLRRENLFVEQRRKVDLKDFGVEKVMMEMLSDPNKHVREER